MYDELKRNLENVIKKESEKLFHSTGEIRIDWMAKDCLTAINDLTTQLAEYQDEECDGRLVRLPETGIGDLSDGYHTFNELYHHRAILFSTICHHAPDIAWKSKTHDDGTMYDGMFIVGLDTPVGSATYHYDIEPYWEMFRVKELDRAPKWDGHTPTDAINRIFKLGSMYADVTQWTAEFRAEAEKGEGE